MEDVRTGSQPVVCSVDAVSPMEVEDSGNYLYLPVGSVADGMFVPDPGSNNSTKRGGEKHFFALLIFVLCRLVTGPNVSSSRQTLLKL